VRQNLVSELLSENASSNLVNNFSHQIFLVKMVRLLGVIFQNFHQIDSPKNYFGETIRNALTGLKPITSNWPNKKERSHYVQCLVELLLHTPLTSSPIRPCIIVKPNASTDHKDWFDYVDETGEW
jgi:hypothetical protein